MPVNYPLLAVYKSLYLVQESILAVQLALDNNPSPEDGIQLNDKLSDLDTLKDELQVMRDGLQDGSVSIPPPDPSLLDHLKDLISRVEAATQAGITATAVIAVVSLAFDTGTAVMSLAK